MEKFDVVIAGGSFAGLAVAGEIADGSVVIIDRKELGSGQTSACGVPVQLVEELGAGEAILQRFDTAAFHSRSRVREVRLTQEWCTLDYGEFCRNLLKRTKAGVIRANVKGLEGGVVKTDVGDVEGKIIIDASGWNATLARSLRPDYVDREYLCFGIETEAPYEDSSLRFFLDPTIVQDGAAWIFPIGKSSRFGVLTFTGRGPLIPELELFLSRYGLKRGRLHGNFIPCRMREPVVGELFVVGDAAGQALPGTLEGIRKSMIYGRKCGQLVQKVLRGEMELRRALADYSSFVNRSRKYYELLLWGQRKLVSRGLSLGILKRFAYHVVLSRPFSGWFERTYMRW